MSAGLAASGCATRNQLNQPVSDQKTASIVQDNPDVGAADARVEQAVASRNRANFNVLPEVNVGADFADNSPSSGSSPTGSDRSSTYASLTVPVTDMLSNFRLANSADAGVNAVVSGYNGTMQSALLATVDAIAAARQSAEVVRERRKELHDLRAFHSISQKRHAAGLVSKSDLHQIRLSIANSRASLSDAIADHDAATTQKDALLAGNPEFDVGISRLKRFVPATREEALTTASNNNPQLDELAWRLAEAKHKVAAAKYKILPKAVLSLSQNRYLNDNQVDTLGDEDTRVKFSLSVPLTRSLATRSEIRAERARYREIEKLGRAGTRDVAVQTEVAWRQYKAAKEAVRLYKQSVAAARRAFDGVRKANEVGAKLPADQLDAQSDLTSARISLVNARYRQLTQLHALLARMGVIGQAYGVHDLSYEKAPAAEMQTTQNGA